LRTLLEEIFEQTDAKVVVFSQWLRTYELIIRRLTAASRAASFAETPICSRALISKGSPRQPRLQALD
jgi:hypothetical protein